MNAFSNAVIPLAEHQHLVTAGLSAGLAFLGAPFEWFLTPRARQFRLDNESISYPLSPEHVPVGLLAFLVLIVPIALLVAPAIGRARFRRHSAISVLGLAFTISATFFICSLLKHVIGNQRPDFLSRCQPQPGTPTDVYVSVQSVCTNSDWAVLWEGCKSTPSGHSSLAFASMVFLSLWISNTFEFGGPYARVARAGVLAPIVIAAFIAYTRIIDHKHHWIDIIIGCVLGTTIAIFSYRRVVADSSPEKIPSYELV